MKRKTPEVDKILDLYYKGLITEEEVKAHKKNLQLTPDEREQGRYKSVWGWYFYALKKSFSIKGRATRAEFFSFAISNFCILLLLAFGVVLTATYTQNIVATSTALFVLSFYFAFTLITQATLYIRRFHDQNYSATFAFMPAIVWISACICFVFPAITILGVMISNIMNVLWGIFLFFKGTQGENEYGIEVKNITPKSTFWLAILIILMGFGIAEFYKIKGAIAYQQVYYIVEMIKINLL